KMCCMSCLFSAAPMRHTSLTCPLDDVRPGRAKKPASMARPPRRTASAWPVKFVGTDRRADVEPVVLEDGVFAHFLCRDVLGMVSPCQEGFLRLKPRDRERASVLRGEEVHRDEARHPLHERGHARHGLVKLRLRLGAHAKSEERQHHGLAPYRGQ